MISFGYVVTAIFLLIRLTIFVGIVYLIVYEVKGHRRRDENESNSESNTGRRSKSSGDN